MPAWGELIHSGLAGWVPRERTADGRWVAAPESTWEGVGEVEVDPADDQCLWAKRGPGILLSSREGTTADLFSRAELGSCELYLELLVPAETGWGVYLLGQYEIPGADEELAPGEWHTVKLTFRAPRFDEAGRKVANARFERVRLDDAVIHDLVECGGPSPGAASDVDVPRGSLRLRGDLGPVAYRDIRVQTIFE